MGVGFGKTGIAIPDSVGHRALISLEPLEVRTAILGKSRVEGQESSNLPLQTGIETRLLGSVVNQTEKGGVSGNKFGDRRQDEHFVDLSGGKEKL